MLSDIKEKETFDEENKVLDFHKQKVTDMKTVRRLHLPEAIDDEDELLLQRIKYVVNDEWTKYVKENCNSKGEIRKNTTLTKAQKQGKDELVKQIADEDIVCGVTDKSSKLFIMSKESYEKEAMKHIGDDVEIFLKEIKERENKLNVETLHWRKMFKIGENWNQRTRIESALRSTDCQIPPLTLLLKDHKQIKDDGNF